MLYLTTLLHKLKNCEGSFHSSPVLENFAYQTPSSGINSLQIQNMLPEVIFSLAIFVAYIYIYKIVNVLRSIILLVLLSSTNEISCVSMCVPFFS